MELADLNPFLRYADVQPSLLNGRSFRMAYDYRLFYVLRGSGTLILKTGEIPLTDGCAVFLPPETPYYTRSLMRVISLNFDLDQSQRSRPKALDPSPEAEFDPSLVFEHHPPAELARPFVLEGCSFLETPMNRLVVAFQFPDVCSGLLCSAILKEALSDLLRRRLQPREKMAPPVYRAVHYIKSHYQRPLPNEEIAAAVGYNALYLNRMFKACTGMTLHAYVLREKLSAAALLLHGTDLSVEAVAEACGFADSGALGTVFRQRTGYSPLEFRKSGLSALPERAGR